MMLIFCKWIENQVGQRFLSLLKQLCLSKNNDQIKKPIYDLSLILSKESTLIESINNT
jgi:hypothetical protein